MLNLSNVQTLLVSVLGLAVVAAGVKITTAGKRAEISDTARTAGNTLLGVVVACMGVGIITTMAFGQRVLNWIGVSGFVHVVPTLRL